MLPFVFFQYIKENERIREEWQGNVKKNLEEYSLRGLFWIFEAGTSHILI